MPLMEPTRGFQRLVQRPKDHREDDLERPMETPDRVRQGRRVVRDGCGDPGMGELHQERATGTDEHGGLSVDMPDGRTRAEYALNGSACILSDEIEASLKGGIVDDRWMILHGLRCVAVIDYGVLTSDAILFASNNRGGSTQKAGSLRIALNSKSGQTRPFPDPLSTLRAIIKAMKRLMTKKEAAEYCGLSHRGFGNWVGRG